MKKYITRIILFIIICAFAILPINSFATSTLKVSFEQGYSAKPGEVIDIPIILSDVNMDGKQKGLIDFACNINVDDVFEIIKNNDKYVSVNEDNKKYIQTSFDSNNKKLIFNVSGDFFTDKGNSLKSYIEIGTMKIKVKEGTKAGEYNVKIQNIVGENGEASVKGADTSTKIRVKAEKTTEDDDDNSQTPGKVTSKLMYFWEQGEAKLYVIQNETGTQVTIVPNEENGAKIGKIIVNGKEIQRVDGKYVIDTEFGDTLDITVYGEDGKFLMSKTYIVINDEVYENNFGSVEEGANSSTGKTHSTNRNSSSSGQEAGNKGNKGTDSPKASPQTGDVIFVSVAMLTLASAVLIATQIIKKRIEE